MTGTLHGDLRTFMITSRWILSEWEMFQTSVEKMKTYLVFSKFYFRRSCHLWDNEENCCRTGQATDDNIIWRMCFACWITMAADAHSRYVNTYYFYKATMITRTRLSNTFVPALFVLFQLSDLSSFPLAQMLTRYKTVHVVCGLCDLTIVNSLTALQQAKSRFLQFPLSHSRISTIFFF
jgi:hypothetical protein